MSNRGLRFEAVNRPDPQELPYQWREEDPLDMDFIMKKGGFGECNFADRLGL